MNGKPRLIIDAIQVGHGDCTLISWNNGRMKSSWNCIIDAGDGDTLHNQEISNALDKHGITSIDLAIVSHFDTDHIGGFSALCDKIRIKSFWSPYTPAFKKYSWLFGSRGQQAIDRASILEGKLDKNKIEMLSPLDGFVNSPAEDLRISVFSPPSKLYERLLSGRDVEELFSSYPTPIETISKDTFDYSREEFSNPLIRGYQNRRFGSVVKRNLIMEQNETRSTRHNLEIDEADKNAICSQQNLGPEFFGNHLLNDTSFVIKLEFWLGSQWFSSLFPGDLENWVYVLKKHQSDLYSNYFKVSHHGGRVFIGRDDGLDQVFQAIRPTFSSISAIGKYGLPHSATREALVRWSSSVFCSMKKGSERFSLHGSLPFQEKSCKDTFGCQKREEGNTFTIEANSAEINNQSCQRIYTPNSLPVIQFEQHFIPDSKLLTNLSERDIDKQTGYVKKYLNEVHKERISCGNLFDSKPVSIEEIQTKMLQDNRHLTQRQIEQIFKHGYLNGEFWSAGTEGSWSDAWKQAYKSPTSNEINKMWEILKKKDLLISPIDMMSKGATTILSSLQRDNFAVMLENKTAYPQQLIDKYVWPMLIPDILNLFNTVYVESRNINSRNFLFLIRKNIKSFKDVVKKEMQGAPKISSQYSYNNYYVDLYKKYADGEGNIILLKSSVKTKNGNEIKLEEELFDAFNEISGYSTYYYRYNIIPFEFKVV